jgi:hypothetical protein
MSRTLKGFGQTEPALEKGASWVLQPMPSTLFLCSTVPVRSKELQIFWLHLQVSVGENCHRPSIHSIQQGECNIILLFFL